MDIAESLDIDAVPTFVIVKGSTATSASTSLGTVLDRVQGANPLLLSSTLEKYANKAQSFSTLTSSASASTSVPQIPLETRLHQLIDAHPIMLFMKGSPAEPRCGFSRKVVDLFKELNVKYGSFDILGDSEVREGLKKFSDWPTYPQVKNNSDGIG